jgi:hypothetical protein
MLRRNESSQEGGEQRRMVKRNPWPVVCRHGIFESRIYNNGVLVRVSLLISILSMFQMVEKCSHSKRKFCVQATDPTMGSSKIVHKWLMVPQSY